MLEVAIREYHDAEGGAGEMENVFEGSSARGGPRRTGDVRRPTTGSGGARDAAGGAGARGSASAGVASLRPSMSAFQGSVGSGESVGRDKRSRPLMLLVVDLLIMSATDLQNVLKKLPREGTRWRGKDMRANGLVEASCVPEEAMVSHCLEILRLLLESCRIDQLELVAEILDLKRAQGWGDHCFGLIDHESVSPCIKLSCLSLLRVMVPCKEFRDAVCPPIHVDEVLDGKSGRTCRQHCLVDCSLDYCLLERRQGRACDGCVLSGSRATTEERVCVCVCVCARVNNQVPPPLSNLLSCSLHSRVRSK